jgi:hypothetical protein
MGCSKQPSRVFGGKRHGKRYWLYDIRTRRDHAEQQAAWLRSRDYLVRVLTPKLQYYEIWTSPKRKMQV